MSGEKTLRPVDLGEPRFFCLFMLFNFVFFRWIVSIFVSDCVIVKTSKIISVIGSTVTVKLTKL